MKSQNLSIGTIGEVALRQIHLDFHTSPLIPEVGAKFNAIEFADILSEAGVQSVTLFAKCHHGHLYYDTPSPARHPGLRRPLLEEQIEALRGKGIRCPIYLSVQCDEYAANQHPDWRVINPDGTLFGRKAMKDENFAWQFLDMSSPYADYLEEQLMEVLQRFSPVDGLFFDMCWDQPSVSKWALSGMRKHGLNPENEADRMKYGNIVTIGYMERFNRTILKFQKDTPIFFNGRRMSQVAEDRLFLTHVEVEALPTGQWGYSFFPLHIRLVKTSGMPMIGMTGRFHKSWADFGGLRTIDSLYYDCAQAVAHGAACSVGDQLHPSGRLDRGAYEVIGQAFQKIGALKTWVEGAVSPKEIAVLYRDPLDCPMAGEVQEGVTRALIQLGYQFDFVLPSDEWEEYPALIIPESIEMQQALETRVDGYIKNGGRVLHADMRGVPSPFTCTYLRFCDEALGVLPLTDHVFYEKGTRLIPRTDDRVLAWIVEPYFERNWEHFSSHAQTPPLLEASPYAAAVVRERTAILTLPLFGAYARHGNLASRQLLAAALEILIPEPQIRIAGPSYVETVIADLGDRRIVHLFSYIPQKRTPSLELIEDAVAARNIGVDLWMGKEASKVISQPSNQSITFTNENGRVRFLVEWVEGHLVIVVE